jgi:predicted TIM-barrel fold metal-dependent hydrolase
VAGPRLVDAHTHLLPDRLAQAIRAYFTQALPPQAFPYPAAPRAARDALVAAGVHRCWSLPYVRRGGAASAITRWMAETWGGDPVVEPGATVHPDDEVEMVVEEALSLGLRLFKLHCAVGSFSLADDRLTPLWERVARLGLPVVVHLGHSPIGPTEADELPVLEAVARAWPGVRLVLAHLGSPSIAEALALLRRCSNVYGDLTPVMFQPVALQPGDLEGLEDRILFGSDVPTVGFSVETSIQHLRGLGLSARAEAAVLADNADRLVSPP